MPVITKFWVINLGTIGMNCENNTEKLTEKSIVVRTQLKVLLFDSS